jgi:hypothetical protein
MAMKVDWTTAGAAVVLTIVVLMVMRKRMGKTAV